MVVEEIRKRRRQDAKSVCVKRRHGAIPAWAMSAGEVLQEELAPGTCFFCCLLLLLLKVLLLHEGTHTRCRRCTRANRQPEATLSQTGKKSSLCHSSGKLGQSKACGEFSANRMQPSNLISPIYGSTIICFPNIIIHVCSTAVGTQ